MSRTYKDRTTHKKQSESRQHSLYHKFDGHKMAQQVNLAYTERHASSPMIERRGMRGK